MFDNLNMKQRLGENPAPFQPIVNHCNQSVVDVEWCKTKLHAMTHKCKRLGKSRFPQLSNGY